jgi:D-alanyl-D-alanine carboxypeptidase
MKRLILSLSIVLILGTGTAQAITFDPNFIISDTELQSYLGYTVSDIQNILQSKNSFLAVYRAPDVRSVTKSAAEIIHQAAFEHRINPKYIITTLQKEQSLITSISPSTNQLDWATGYGICDSCSKSDPALQKHKGFGVQVDSAAGIMRWYYNNIGQNFVKKTGSSYTIDDNRITPASNATGFLYTYTPHIAGNRNFWNIWQNWFSEYHPDGTLLEDSQGRLYLTEGNKKHLINSLTFDLKDYNIRNRIPADGMVLSRYESSSDITDNAQHLIHWNGGFFLVSGNSVHRFDSPETVDYHHFMRQAIPVISDDEFFKYNIGTEITKDTLLPGGGLVQLESTNTYYYAKMGKLYPITDNQIISANYATDNPIIVKAKDMASLPLGNPVKLKNGTLFGVTGHNLIYIVENGKKRHITSEKSFNSYGYDWKNIHWVSPLTGFNHPVGQPLTGISRDMVTTASTNTTPPISTNDKNKKMIKTPTERLRYEGSKQFTTDIDTYLVADYDTGEILAGKNIDEPRPLASLTKLMTAYRLYAEGINTEGSVRYESKKHRSIYHRFRIAEGEVYLNLDLFMSFLVSSLNTPGKMLVSSVEKKESEFIKRMNEQTKKWGLSKTKFTDVTGEDLGNISTAREYLTIFKKTTENVDIRYYSSRPSYTYYELTDKDNSPKHFDTNSNLLVAKSSKLPFNILSSKTGYLDESGDMLAMLIERPNSSRRFTVITMGNPDRANRFDEPERFARWVIDNF